MSATSAPRGSPLQAVRCSSERRLYDTRRPRWDATSGPCPGSGEGTVATVLEEPGGAILGDFHARDLHLVMRPAVPAAPCVSGYELDGRPPGRPTASMSTTTATAR